MLLIPRRDVILANDKHDEAKGFGGDASSHELFWKEKVPDSACLA
jgi:phosphopantothenoylcysteine synthetase/decarboxylase